MIAMSHVQTAPKCGEYDVARCQTVRTPLARDFRQRDGRRPYDRRQSRGDDGTVGRGVPLLKQLHQQEHTVRTHHSTLQEKVKYSLLGAAEKRRHLLRHVVFSSESLFHSSLCP